MGRKVVVLRPGGTAGATWANGMYFTTADADPYICTDDASAPTWEVRRCDGNGCHVLPMEAPVKSDYAIKAPFGWLLSAYFGTIDPDWCHLEVERPDGTQEVLLSSSEVRDDEECSHFRSRADAASITRRVVRGSLSALAAAEILEQVVPLIPGPREVWEHEQTSAIFAHIDTGELTPIEAQFIASEVQARRLTEHEVEEASWAVASSLVSLHPRFDVGWSDGGTGIYDVLHVSGFGAEGVPPVSFDMNRAGRIWIHGPGGKTPAGFAPITWRGAAAFDPDEFAEWLCAVADVSPSEDTNETPHTMAIRVLATLVRDGWGVTPCFVDQWSNRGEGNWLTSYPEITSYLAGGAMRPRDAWFVQRGDVEFALDTADGVVHTPDGRSFNLRVEYVDLDDWDDYVEEIVRQIRSHPRKA